MTGQTRGRPTQLVQLARVGLSCGRCGRRLPDNAYICSQCQRGTASQVQLLADLLDGDVLATVARQDRHGEGSGHGEAGMPVNLSAAARAITAAATVLEVAGDVAAKRGVQLPGQPGLVVGPLCRHGLGCQHRSCYEIRHRYVPAPPVVAARWLVGQLGWVRYRPWADQAFTQLENAAAGLARVVDSPPERIYRGPCEQPTADGWCDGELYARPAADWVRCPKCGTEHEVARRTRWLADVVRDRAYTAADISAAYPIKAGTIRQWAARGRLVAHGHDDHGRPMYPLGEVLDLAAADAGRRATQQARRQRAADRRADQQGESRAVA